MGHSHLNNMSAEKVTKADAKGRVQLGTSNAGREFRVTETASGYMLEPVRSVVVPEDEAWLWENPEAIRSVLKGIGQSLAGKGRKIKDLDQFADVDPDETGN